MGTVKDISYLQHDLNEERVQYLIRTVANG